MILLFNNFLNRAGNITKIVKSQQPLSWVDTYPVVQILHSFQLPFQNVTLKRDFRRIGTVKHLRAVFELAVGDFFLYDPAEWNFAEESGGVTLCRLAGLFLFLLLNCPPHSHN